MVRLETTNCEQANTHLRSCILRSIFNKSSYPANSFTGEVNVVAVLFNLHHPATISLSPPPLAPSSLHILVNFRDSNARSFDMPKLLSVATMLLQLYVLNDPKCLRDWGLDCITTRTIVCLKLSSSLVMGVQCINETLLLHKVTHFPNIISPFTSTIHPMALSHPWHQSPRALPDCPHQNQSRGYHSRLYECLGRVPRSSAPSGGRAPWEFNYNICPIQLMIWG